MPHDILLPSALAVKQLKVELEKGFNQFNAFFELRGCNLEGNTLTLNLQYWLKGNFL